LGVVLSKNIENKNGIAMMWLCGLLLLANVIFFVFAQRDGVSADEKKHSKRQPSLNPEKIKLLVAPSASSGVSPVSSEPARTQR